MIGRGPATLGAFYRLAAGEAIAKVAGLVAFAWLARRLGPDGYGAVEVAVSIALIAGLVVDAGLGPVGARAVGLAPESASPLAARIPTLRLLLAASCLGAVAVALPLMSSPWEHRALTVLFTLSVLGWIWNQNWLCQGLGRPALASAAQPVRMGVFALGVLLLVRSPSDLLRVGWLEIAGVLALAGYFLWAQGRLGVPVSLRFEHIALAALLREALPVGLGQFLWAIGHALPILLTAALLGGDEVAWIGAAVRIEIGLHAFVWLYYFALYPRLVSATGTADPELGGLLRRAQARIVWLVLPIAIAGAVASGPLARLVFGGGFDRAASVLETALWALPIAAASGTSRFLLIAAGRQRLELVAAAVGAAAVALCGFAPSRHVEPMGRPWPCSSVGSLTGESPPHSRGAPSPASRGSPASGCPPPRRFSPSGPPTSSTAAVPLLRVARLWRSSGRSRSLAERCAGASFERRSPLGGDDGDATGGSDAAEAARSGRRPLDG